MTTYSRQNVIILSKNDFPNGDAGAVRDLAFAKIYQELGCNVLCIGLGKNCKQGVFEGVSYVSIAIPKSGIIKRLQSEFGYKARMERVLRTYVDEFGSINVFHIVDIPFNAICFLKQYARNTGGQLIHDSVEWYSPSNFKYGRCSKAYIMKTILNTYIIDRQFSVIAISKYLEAHFSKKGIRTIRIPVIMDTSISLTQPKSDNVIKIVYAGDPAKKDYVKEIIMGFGILSETNRRKIQLNIIGVNREQLLSSTALNDEDLSKLGPSLQVHGRITRNRVLEELKNMDFSILLRPPGERYSMAGFPTKVVESLASATPIICNITSDLGDYLNDDENALILKGCTSQDVAYAFTRVLSMSNEQIIDMKLSASETAVKFFDYKQYSNDLLQIVHSKQ